MFNRTLRIARRIVFGGAIEEIARLEAEVETQKNLAGGYKSSIAELKRNADSSKHQIEELEKRWEYASDGLSVAGRTVGFMQDPSFWEAYNRGMNSGHIMGREHGSDKDIGIHWRAHVALWVAQQCAQLAGDFVECGVNTGVFSLAICHQLKFQNLPKRFYLFDTFCGIPEKQANDAELGHVKLMNDSIYFDCFELASKNFAEFPNAILVRGEIPDSLKNVEIEKVSYLHIDLNLSYPERQAMEYFWPKLTPGAMILLDDYGHKAHIAQKETADDFAKSVGRSILELPTGQGLFLK